jgi:hypothetical protein
MTLKETLVIDIKSSTDGRFLLSQNRSHCRVQVASPVSNWYALLNRRCHIKSFATLAERTRIGSENGRITGDLSEAMPGVEVFGELFAIERAAQ